VVRTAWHIVLAVNAKFFELLQLFFARVFDVGMSHHIAAHNAPNLRAKHAVGTTVQNWFEIAIRDVSIGAVVTRE
jgi:hypothetical protein